MLTVFCLSLRACCLFCYLSLFCFTTHAVEDTAYLQDPDHQFWFAGQDLPILRITFTEQQWQLLLTSTQQNRVEVSADFSFTTFGQTHSLNRIGVKLGGNTSFTLPQSASDPYIQANFTLDFDQYIDDQELKGLTALKLKRFVSDSTFVHETLSNKIMQNFQLWTAHSSVYCKLEIQVGNTQPSYFGVYRMNESVNRQEYIDKRFAADNDSGFLWQGNYKDFGIAHFSRITENWEGVSESDNASFEYKGKGSKYPEARAQLVELAKQFTQLIDSDFEDYVDRHINMPLFLKGLAAEAVLGHWDGFWGNGNNFMFYIDEQVVLHFIPFDLDNALGTSLFVDDVGERDPMIFGRTSSEPMLVTKILAIDKYRLLYRQYLKQLVSESNLMVENYAVQFIEAAHELIKNDLNNITNENEQIIDKPASWGNQPGYRLFDFSNGKNWYATRKAAVLAIFKPPIANAGVDIEVEQDTTVQFDASASTDPDGNIESYEWSNGMSGVSPTMTFATVGEYTLVLTVTDNEGLSATDEVTIKVAAKTIPVFLPVPTNSASGGSLTVFVLLSIGVFSLLKRAELSNKVGKKT
jgi:spore coat protein H